MVYNIYRKANNCNGDDPLDININTDYRHISPYVIMVLAAFGAGITLQHILNVKRGIKRRISGMLILLEPMMSLFFALLLTYIASGGKAIGLYSVGGAFGMYMSVLTMALITQDRGQGKVMFENCTLVMPLMYGISKTGCFMAGCCHGIDYNGPLCVEYSGRVTQTGCVFPVQLAETAVFILIFAIGMIKARKNAGAAVLTVILSSALAKGLLDFLRASHSGRTVSLNQLFCGAMIIVCVAVALWLGRKSNTEKDK